MKNTTLIPSLLARTKSRALDAFLFSLFSLLFIGGIVYAISFPATGPGGIDAGGKFATVFNRILVSNYLTDTTGKVKSATSADTVPWSGVSGKPAIPTNVSQLVNDSGYLTKAEFLCINKGGTLIAGICKKTLT